MYKKNEAIMVCDCHGHRKEKKTSQGDEFLVSTRTFIDNVFFGIIFCRFDNMG